MIPPISHKRVNLNHKYNQRPWLRYAGDPKCPYIERDCYLALEMAAKVIYYEFPDRPDRTLWLGDACPFTGGCAECGYLRSTGGKCGGHPGGSHSHRRTIDLNYYTLVGFDKSKGHWGNITQYAPKGMSTTPIWKGDKVDLTKFDAERNFRFSIVVKQILGIDPSINYGSQEDLVIEMGKYAKNRDERIFFNHRTGETSGKTYNHHIHVHLVMKNPNTWSYLNLKRWL